MKQAFGYFLKNAKFRAALGLTLLLSYGYAIATTRVSIDSLEGERYIGTGGVMLSTGRFGIVARQGPQFFFKSLETEIDAESCLVVQEQRADRRQFYGRAGVHERQLGGVTGVGHRRQDRAVQASGHYTTVTGVGHAGSHPQLV